MHRVVPVLLLFFILLYLIPLGVRPLMIPDETRYVEIPREMIDTGQWIVPHLNGLRYFEKPVLGYWIEAAAQLLFGPNRFAARLPSALAAGCTAWLLFLLVRQGTGKSSVAVLTPVVYLTFAEVFFLGGFNTLDGPFTFFVTGCLVAFFLARTAQRPSKRRRLLAISGACCGLAFLTKGFLAVAFPVFIILPFLYWERDFRGLRSLLGIPLGAVLLIALPWSIAIFIKEPDFWRYFIQEEHFHRFFSSEAKHVQPIWFFLPVLLAGSFPWTVFFPAAFSGIRQKGSLHSLHRLALCWFLGPLLLLSLSQGKLVTYILPCFPPLAVLLALGLTERTPAERDRTFSAGAAFLALFTGLFALLLLMSTGKEPMLPARLFGAVHRWNMILAGAVMALSSIFFCRAARHPSRYPRTILAGIASPLLLVSLYFLIPDNIPPAKVPGTFLRTQLRHPVSETALVTESVLAPALCWYFNRNDIFLIQESGEFAYGLSYPDAAGRYFSLKDFNTFLKQRTGTERVLLILREAAYERWKDRLPEPESIQRRNGFVMAEYLPVRPGGDERSREHDRKPSKSMIAELSSSGQT